MGGRRLPPRFPATVAPQHADRPPLTHADVRLLIADAVSWPPQVQHAQAQPPPRVPTADAADDTARPLPQSPPPPARPMAQQVPPPPAPGAGPEGRAAAPELRQALATAHVSPPAQQRVAADSRTSRLRRRIPAAAGPPSGPDTGCGSDKPATAHAEARAPGVHGCGHVPGSLGHRCPCDGPASGSRRPPTPVAHQPAPTDRALAPQAPKGAGASATPAGDSPPGEPTVDWCDVCRLWRPSPCDQCPPCTLREPAV